MVWCCNVPGGGVEPVSAETQSCPHLQLPARGVAASPAHQHQHYPHQHHHTPCYQLSTTVTHRDSQQSLETRYLLAGRARGEHCLQLRPVWELQAVIMLEQWRWRSPVGDGSGCRPVSSHLPAPVFSRSRAPSTENTKTAQAVIVHREAFHPDPAN